MNIKVYNMDGNIVGSVELPKSFDVPVQPTLIHEVMIGLRANARVAIAHTKTRGEVRGGGKKPWKQKHTGRARHGSIRSPIWIGGGVVGGPRSNRNFSVKINRKTGRKALAMVLSDKARGEKIVVLDKLTLAEPKTKLFAKIMSKLPLGKKTLLILPTTDRNLFRASHNLKKVKTVTAGSFGLLDVLSFDTLLMPRESIEALDKRLV